MNRPLAGGNFDFKGKREDTHEATDQEIAK
ncbi:MAG TPA: peptidylprolyl isomerase, partial [Prevotella sp.]|nr:peptidylprolyl isomerase [Prevotella sp.]